MNEEEEEEVVHGYSFDTAELLYFVNAFVPSAVACLASSPGNINLTAV